MNINKYPEPSTWESMLARPVFDSSEHYEAVQHIIDEVKSKGDVALKTYTLEFDQVALDSLQVPIEEIEQARKYISEDLQNGIKEAKRNIKKFHAGQLVNHSYVETTPGVRCWQKTLPIEKVGLYIPGGSAPLLSTALMLGVPAKLAGCKEIVLCTPPGADGHINPAILYVAHILGIDKVYSIGGAQAIAAMAFGTETIPAVYKIFGPGNQFVMAAKQLVSRDKVAIDMPAGPSELAILADKTANPAFVASDLLSQAEHGPDSQVVLIADSLDMINAVQEHLTTQLAVLPRKEIAEKSLQNSKIILMKNREDMLALVNFYAPEHLIIACDNYTELADQVTNVGSIFLGNYTPESAGDYASGTNHTLPTNGWAHSYGGLNMDSFVKKITMQEISKYGLFNISHAVMSMAEAEELEAHRNAVSIRLKA